MNKCTISADIISYTSFTDDERRYLENNINKLLSDLTQKYRKYNFYGRLIRGDLIECVMDNPIYGLRVALIIKTLIKSLKEEKILKTNNSLKYFFEHGVRLALAVAPLSKIDPDRGIIDGEAIYLSGREIQNQSTWDKKKIIIKNTMFFKSANKELQENMEPLFYLLDTVLSRCSAKQCRVIYYKLLDMSEKEIAEKIKRARASVNQHSTASGWLAIEKALNYYENKSILWK